VVDNRYFEDYPVGMSRTLGPVRVSESEIIEFARRYDPQPLHVDREWAAQGPYGGIIGSGWQTCALVMRAIVDDYISPASALGSPGIDELRWRAPVRPDDTLTITLRVVGARASRSKPHVGIIRTDIAVTNQDDVLVLSMVANNLLLRRPEAG
jgi:acyl dehydratase